MNFKEIRNLYTQAREEERRTLIEHLINHGYKTSTRGGSGIRNYTSGGRIKPYDLQNYKWVEAERNGVTHFISFNPPEQDPHSLNRHFLPDRIGIVSYIGAYSPEYYDKIRVLDIDLPLDANDMAKILKELEYEELHI